HPSAPSSIVPYPASPCSVARLAPTSTPSQASVTAASAIAIAARFIAACRAAAGGARIAPAAPGPGRAQAIASLEQHQDRRQQRHAENRQTFQHRTASERNTPAR